MFTISRQFHFSASHQLAGLPDGHPCARLHGHNYTVDVVLTSGELRETGFVLDYRELQTFQQKLDGELDHRHLNDVLDGQPSAENLARQLFAWAKRCWPEVVSVRVGETPRTWAEFSES